MNLPGAHIERIKDLGYTDSEARFLYIVAVFSGYFTLGHFRVFTGSSYGKRPTSFAQKLLKQGHATIRDYMRRGSIFHLFSRTVYGQIDKDNLRNRKRHSFDFMRSRLVLLDFILANQDLNYFETEQDKVRFFCDELGVPKDSLPAKVYEGGPGGAFMVTDSKVSIRHGARGRSRSVTYGWSFRNSSPTGPYFSGPSWSRNTVHPWQRSHVAVTGA